MEWTMSQSPHPLPTPHLMHFPPILLGGLPTEKFKHFTLLSMLEGEEGAVMGHRHSLDIPVTQVYERAGITSDHLEVPGAFIRLR